MLAQSGLAAGVVSIVSSIYRSAYTDEKKKKKKKKTY
jgi:hypothetical protein